MCLFFSGLCINRNVINNKFYEILRTDGKFEDERFIKPRKIVPIYENAKIKINALKLQDKDQLLNINCYDEIKDDYDDIYKMGKILKSDANTKKNNNLDDIKSEYTQENPDKIIAIKSEIEKNTDSILQGNEKIIDQNIAPTKEFIQIISVRDYFAVSHCTIFLGCSIISESILLCFFQIQFTNSLFHKNYSFIYSIKFFLSFELHDVY